MDRLTDGPTTFMITHRPGTLDGCDRQLVIKDGGIASLEEHLSVRVRSAAAPLVANEGQTRA